MLSVPSGRSKGPDFVEAAIYRVTRGMLSGEYVASCAFGTCGYFGKPLELLVNETPADLHQCKYIWSASTANKAPLDAILVEVGYS
jgi:hypothetical protein